jgi:hypothetical protein
MKHSKFTLILLVALCSVGTLFGQGHWVGSNNTTSPISRTGKVTIGSTTYLHNSSSVNYQLLSEAGTVSYGPSLAVRANNALTGGAGTAIGHLAYAFKWSAHTGLFGAQGSVSASSIHTNYANKDAFALGGDFTSNIDDPVSNPGSAGNYYLGGIRARLIGNISTYPSNGVVASVIALDEIQGSGTYAGYFDGRAYFSGNVGIGVANPTNELEVCGTIRAKEIKVESGWCDYVFEEDYELMSLDQVEAFIQTNGHLPRTPSAAEIQAEGLELAKATENQQEKIEEIFLHLIDMQESLQDLEAENAELKSEIERLKGGK